MTSTIKQVFLTAGIVLATLLITTPAFGAAAETYKAKCAMCHGANGKGDTPVGKKMSIHDFASSEAQSMSDADLATIIAKGKNKMPGYEKSLKEADITELVAYVRQLGKGK
jgi:cytochrome c6